jgi:hypothetical protein
MIAANPKYPLSLGPIKMAAPPELGPAPLAVKDRGCGVSPIRPAAEFTVDHLCSRRLLTHPRTEPAARNRLTANGALHIAFLIQAMGSAVHDDDAIGSPPAARMLSSARRLGRWWVEKEYCCA